MISIPKFLDLYIRVLVLAFALTAGLFFLLASAKAALAANLRAVSVISGENLTVGDIFEGVKAEKAAYVLGPAPQPGRDMVLNAQTLMRVAMALELPWRPASSTDQIIVRRAATKVSEEAIRHAVTAGLRDKGLTELFTVSFTAPEIILPENQQNTVEISTISFDRQKDIFEARLAAPSGANPIVERTVVGKINRMISVPVLKSTLRKGDIIGAGDIMWTDIGRQDIQADTVLKEKDLIGMTPRRLADAGAPLRSTELEPPQIVSRGDFVTIVYDDGIMTLTTKGKALQNGSQGDMVKIVNMSSNRALEGFVSGEREVTVSQ